MSISEWGAPWVPSINTGIFFSFARSTIFAIGKTAPVTFDICVIAIIFVLLVMSFLISSISTSPFSLTGANLITAPFSVLKKFQGT